MVHDELHPPASVLEGLMMRLGRGLSKWRLIVGPCVLALLIFFNVGWYRAEMTSLPFERLWSPRSGRLASEWDYYEDYVVKPAREWNNRVSYVDQRVMGAGSPMTGAGGNVLTAAALDEILKVHEVFYDTNITTSAGNTFFGRDLCKRFGTDAPGPIPADGADTSFDGVGATNATGAWQLADGTPGFVALGGAPVTDQLRANAYYAFQGLGCSALLGGTDAQKIAAMAKWTEKVLYFPMSPEELQADLAVMGQLMATTNCDPTCIGTKDVTDANYQAFAAAFEAELLTNPAHLVAYSFDELVGASAAATAHLASSGFGGTPLMSQATLCLGLMTGSDLGGGIAFANALPMFQLPCQIITMTDCFANPLSVQDPVYANFLDPLLPGRSTGEDMSGALLGSLGSANPSGFTSKPTWTGMSTLELGAAVAEQKWGRYDNRTEILPDAMHPLSYLYGSGLPDTDRFGEPLVSETWANCSTGQVPVYKRPECSSAFDVDGCRVRVDPSTNFTAETDAFNTAAYLGAAALAAVDAATAAATLAATTAATPTLAAALAANATAAAEAAQNASNAYEAALATYEGLFTSRVLDKPLTSNITILSQFLGSYNSGINLVTGEATTKAQLISEMQRCTQEDAEPCTGVLPPHDPLNGVVDMYILQQPYLDQVANYECVTPVEVTTAKQGCQWFATVAQWEDFQMFGDTFTYTDATNTTIAEVPYSFEQYFMSSPNAVVARRALTFPDTTIDEVEEAKELWAAEFDRRLLLLRETTEHVFVNPAVNGYFDRLTDKSEEVPWEWILLGVGLVAVTVVVFFLRPAKVLHSRVELLLLCVGVVLLSLSAALGFFSWIGLQFNQTMTAIIPFLGLAIGIDDCFILVRYFDFLGVQRIMSMELDEIVAHTLKSGGASVTLTSWCNVVAFGLGYMIDVPGLADFCLGAAIVAAVDWLCMMTLVPLCIRLEASRIKARRLLLTPCGPTDTSEGATAPPASTWESMLNGFTTSAWVPFLGKLPVTLLVAVLSCVWFGCAVYYTEGEKLMPLGFVPSDLAQDGTPTHYFFQTVAANYDAYIVDIFGKDLDYPNQQRELVELMASLLALDAIGLFPSPAWLTTFSTSVYGASMGQLGLRNTDVYDGSCYAPGAELPTAGCKPGCSAGAVPDFFSELIPYDPGDASPTCVQVPNPFYCPMDTSYVHPEFLPFGMVDAKCFYGLLSLFTSANLTSAGGTLPFFPAADDPAATANPLTAIGSQMEADQMRKRDNTTRFFITAGVDESVDGGRSSPMASYACADPLNDPTAAGCALYLQGAANDGSAGNPLILTRWSLYMFGMSGANGNEVQTENCKQVRDTIAASPLADKVFPQGEAFTYGEINSELYPVFREAFGIDMAVICVIAILFLQSLVAGVVTAVATAFVVYEVYLALSGLVYFNIISAACLLMSVGIAVEFTAHLVSCYTMETGGLAGAVPKMQYAMKVVGPPLLLGALSTFLGNLPLAFAQTRFVKIYFFQSFSLVVALGVANAVLFLPAKLMLKTKAGAALGLEQGGEEKSQGGRTDDKIAVAETTKAPEKAPTAMVEVAAIKDEAMSSKSTKSTGAGDETKSAADLTKSTGGAEANPV